MSRVIPPGLVIVQVGDLVHKGPESDACVALADSLLRTNPEHYVQLVGNHEAHYLGGPSVSGRAGVVEVSSETRATLERWWETGLMRVAFPASDTEEFGPTLVTHGGLTAGFYREIGSPNTVEAAAKLLNNMAGEPRAVFRPGALMTGEIDYAAGPLCPRSGAELAASWLEEGAIPYSQVHGHEGVWWWPNNDYHDDVPQGVRDIANRDEHRRFSWVTIGGRVLYSVDPVLGGTMPKGFLGAPLVLNMK